MSKSSSKAWHKLDNAAKIFPSTSRKSDVKVFRFCCELTEDIDEELLRSAAEQTLSDFPSFQCVLKRGMFWYYLEQTDLPPSVSREEAPPCSTRYLHRKSLLFDITWYQKRINLEVYHVLTDGTGAMQFLKTLVLYYLKLAHPDEMRPVAGIDFDASESQKMADSFDKYYNPDKKIQKVKVPTAYKLKGAKEAEWRFRIIGGTIPVKEMLSKSREYGITVTVLITVLLIRAICCDMKVRDRKKPVIISIPVNLRNYFDSKSILNFFSIVDIQYYYNSEDTLEDVIKVVKSEFDRQLNKDYLQNRLNNLISLEHNLFARIVPLAIKNVFMSAAYFLAARKQTASISNLGNIPMPEAARPYIKLFDVFTSTNKLQICMCSFGNHMKITITTPLSGTDIQREFFRQLREMGIPVEIAANDLDRRE